MSKCHDDVIKWKHFPRCSLFVRGIHQSPVGSPYRDQWRGALMFSLMCDWTLEQTVEMPAIWGAMALIVTSLVMCLLAAEERSYMLATTLDALVVFEEESKSWGFIYDKNLNGKALGSAWVCWSWWRHEMETFSASLAICAVNSLVESALWDKANLKHSFELGLAVYFPVPQIFNWLVCFRHGKMDVCSKIGVFIYLCRITLTEI